MASRSPAADHATSAASTKPHDLPEPSGPLPGAFDDTAFDEGAFSPPNPPNSPSSVPVLLVPTHWHRFVYRAWRPATRSFLATLLIVAVMPFVARIRQQSDANEAGGNQPTTIVAVSVPAPVTVTSVPPVTIQVTDSITQPVTGISIRSETINTTGPRTRPEAINKLIAVDPKRARTAVMCSTVATIDLTVTGKGNVGLVVTGAATAHTAGNGAARLRVSGQPGSYTFTYAASGGSLDINWSALRGTCSA